MNESTGVSTAKQANGREYLRPGVNNIAPYFLVEGAARFMDFLMAAFAGKEIMREPRPDGAILHGEVGLGDSILEISEAREGCPPRRMTIHLYVGDADATYAQAMAAGAKSIYEVSDQPWGDRQGCVADPFGNVWYVATPKGWTPGPEGLRTVQPYLHLRDAHKMIPFLASALGAQAEGVAMSPEGKVRHATLRIDYATLGIAEAEGEFQPTPGYFHVYFPDVDAVFAAAVRAGATAAHAPQDMPYGERSGTVQDPFGNTWFLATYRG